MGAVNICVPTTSTFAENGEHHSSDESDEVENSKETGVYLYVEYPVSIDFEKYPWRDANPISKQFDGLISKTWLSGIDDHTIGGFYEFDSEKNAQDYIDDHLMDIAQQFGVEGTYKIYSKEKTKDASAAMNSPYCK